MSLLHKTLVKIQAELKAPKSQYNKFGDYYYRNVDDILCAVKPLLGDCVLTLNDDVVEVGGRVYIKAIATLSNGEQNISVNAFARETLERKKYDASQLTGAASTYARKYALNGLFGIDDTRDADAGILQPETTELVDQPKPCHPKTITSIMDVGKRINADIGQALVHFHVNTLGDLTQLQGDRLLNQLNKREAA